MKHNLKITLILITMFLITQIIGLFVIISYQKNSLPYGIEPPKEIDPVSSKVSIIFAFLIALTLFFLLMKIKAETFIRLWFFTVTVIALGISLNAIFFKLKLPNSSIIALISGIFLSYAKIFKKNVTIHNLTELLIYPGIAAIFVPVIDVLGITLLLLLISLYDIWAVWHTSFMQKMAEYQIKNLKVFTGFFVPYIRKKDKKRIEELKEKYSKSQIKFEENLKKSKIKISLAILGGGDVVFPIITAGVFYRFFGLIPSLIIFLTALLALLFLLVFAKKEKFYPAMPFLTIGMYSGMIISWLFF